MGNRRRDCAAGKRAAVRRERAAGRRIQNIAGYGCRTVDLRLRRGRGVIANCLLRRLRVGGAVVRRIDAQIRRRRAARSRAARRSADGAGAGAARTAATAPTAACVARAAP